MASLSKATGGKRKALSSPSPSPSPMPPRCTYPKLPTYSFSSRRMSKLTAEYLGLSEGDQTMLFRVSGEVVHPDRCFVVAACLRHALPCGGNELFRIAIDPSLNLFVRVFTDNACTPLNNKPSATGGQTLVTASKPSFSPPCARLSCTRRTTTKL